MKYTIELTEKQANQINDIMIGINASWGYASAPKLKIDIPIPMKESPAYKKGFEDGKKQAINELPELANKENEIYNDGYKKALEDAEMANRYFYDTDKKLLSIPEKVSLWKEEKKKAREDIRVGDEVKSGNALMIVTRVNKVLGYISGVCADGEYFDRDPKKWHKTGRHFDEIEQILDKLRGEE